MKKGKGLKQFTLKHLGGKAEAKNFKELFSNSEEKKMRTERKKKLTKTCALEAYAVAY